MNIRRVIELAVEASNNLMAGGALIERYVLRNGKEMKHVPWLGSTGEPHACFMNSFNIVEGLHYAKEEVFRYVEGYLLIHDMPLLIHHAWLVDVDGYVIEITIPEEKLARMNPQYFGVTYDYETVRAEVYRNGYYGILSDGEMANHDFIFRQDPELKQEMEVLRAKSDR